jgi:diguanylate cyclase (GGDEF)-like protein
VTAVAISGLTARWQETVRRLRPTVRDPLTGLDGRDALERRAPALIGDALAEDRLVALLVVDLDGFKSVNDTAGHHVGDRLLREVAARLRSAVGRHDLVVRLGGDEFAVLTEDVFHAAEADDLAATVVATVGAHWDVDDLTLAVSASVGVAVLGADGTTFDDLLRAADQAMYAAKRDGRGKPGPGQWRACRDRHATAVRLGPDGASPADARTPALLRDLQKAPVADQIVVHYQPQVDLRTGAVVGFESLARWDHPELGLLDAREFVPLAERSGLMAPITEAVLDQALGDYAALQAAVPGSRLSLNVTRRHLLAADPLQGLLDRLDRLGMPHEDLVLEITEPLGAAAPEVGDLFARLDEHGLAVSVRGFGTAGSSLTALWSNPAACEVKIDASVVRSVVADQNARRLVRALVSAGHGLGMRVVGMGVERPEIAEALRDLRCDLAQGFWFCRPGPLESVLRWVSVRDAS